MRLRLRRAPEPDPTHLTVFHEGEEHEVAVRRLAAAKRITLRYSGATGRIVITLPPRADLKTAQTFLATQAGWVAARAARRPEQILFTVGAVLPLRGEPHRIVSLGGTRGVARTGRDEGGAAVILVPGEPSAVPGRVRRFLAAEAERDLREAATRYAGQLGRPIKRITIRDTVSRWGSCSSTGCLNFSWRLILAPPHVLDYLAAHEVAHLAEMNHSHRFWRLLKDLCPGTDAAEAWLKRHGTSLHRFG